MTEVINNETLNRFELPLDKEVAFANYRIENKTLYINYVECPVSLRGTGAAGKLMEGIIEIARRDNYKIIPICSYAVSWLRRHNEHHDLLA